MTLFHTETDVQVKTRLQTSHVVFGVIASGFLAILSTYLIRYQTNSVQCEELTETSCIERSACQSIYQENGSFMKCIQLEDSALQEMKKNEKLCSSTGGRWQDFKYGSYCDCSGTGKIFSPSQGCR